MKTQKKYETIKLIVLLVLALTFLNSAVAPAQVNQDWVKTYQGIGQSDDEARSGVESESKEIMQQ